MCKIIETGIDDALDFLYSIDSGLFEPAVSFGIVQKINQLKSKFRENYESYSITRNEYEAKILCRYQTEDKMRYHFTESMPESEDLSRFKYPERLITEQSADYMVDALEELNELSENDYGRVELDYYFWGNGYLGRPWTLTQYLDNRCY